MKRNLIIGLATTVAAASLAITQLSTAADSKTPPAPEQAAPQKGPRPDKGGPCGMDKFGSRFHGRGGPGGGPGGFGHHRGGPPMWGHDLNLTSEQKEKVKAIMEANKPKFKAIMDEQRAKMQALMDETQKELRPILTPAQQQVLDDTIKLRESQRKLREDAAAAKKDKSE